MSRYHLCSDLIILSCRSEKKLYLLSCLDCGCRMQKARRQVELLPNDKKYNDIKAAMKEDGVFARSGAPASVLTRG